MDRDKIPYFFAGELGKGGFGVVHLITTDNGPKLALKSVDLRRLPEDHRERAKEEAKILQTLNHRHLVHHVNSYIIHPYMCIITEFCEAGDLDKVISRLGFTSGLPEKLLVCWLMQSCEALHYMHTHNPVVLHRDLKPQNIFLTATGDIRLGDLGLARKLMGPQDMANTVAGTILYISPEMLAQQPYNSKTDIWSLGCVFYYITGKKGNDELGVIFLLMQVMQGRGISLPDSYSEGLRNTIRSMLCKDQKLRASAAHVLNSRVIQDFIQNPQKPLEIIADHARKNGRQVPTLAKDLSDMKCGFTPFDQDKILVKSEMLQNLKASLDEDRKEGIATQTVTQAVKQMKLNPAMTVAGMSSNSLALFGTTKGGNATGVNDGAVGGLAVDNETFFDSQDEPEFDEEHFLLQIQGLQCDVISGLGQEGQDILMAAYGVIDNVRDMSALVKELQELMGKSLYDRYGAMILKLRLLEYGLHKKSKIGRTRLPAHETKSKWSEPKYLQPEDKSQWPEPKTKLHEPKYQQPQTRKSACILC